jgi:hypothetical protein
LWFSSKENPEHRQGGQIKKIAIEVSVTGPEAVANILGRERTYKHESYDCQNRYVHETGHRLIGIADTYGVSTLLLAVGDVKAHQASEYYKPRH